MLYILRLYFTKVCVYTPPVCIQSKTNTHFVGNWLNDRWPRMNNRLNWLFFNRVRRTNNSLTLRIKDDTDTHY